VTVYCVIVAPPLEEGAVNVTVAWLLPAVAVTAVGGPGATALTGKDWLTGVAAKKLPFPAWLALIVQLPAATNVRTPPVVTAHTPVVDDVKVGVNPDDAVAVNVGVVPKFCAFGLANVIVWFAFGVTAFDAADAGPIPMELVALTVNV
jgi:hypothetical protein